MSHAQEKAFKNAYYMNECHDLNICFWVSSEMYNYDVSLKFLQSFLESSHLNP